ncbi:MAG: hypothetical protein AB7V45_06615 [Candidatus Krumholzibacteriia bacterium]
MKRIPMTTKTGAALALLICAGTAAAGDLPVQAHRFWAPAGDLVGQEDHFAATFLVLDDHGSTAKIAEDWQLIEQYAGEGLFRWSGKGLGGGDLVLRGYGTTQTGDFNGRFGASCSRTGRMVWNLDYRLFDNFYDTTSEMRTYAFSLGSEPPVLEPAPALGWNRGRFGLRYHLADGLDARVGYVRMARDGDKSSLDRLHGSTVEYAQVPGRKVLDLTSQEFTVGFSLARGNLGTDLELGYRGYDGTRTIDDDRTVADDHKTTSARLDLAYDMGPSLRLLGGGSLAKVENDGSETRDGGGRPLTTETDLSAGRLGAIARLGDSAVLRLGAVVQARNTEGDLDAGTDEVLAVDRERKSTDLRARLSYTGISRTRLQGHVGYKTSDLDEVTTSGGLPGGQVEAAQIVAQEKTTFTAGFDASRRLSRKVSLRLDFGYSGTETDELTTNANGGTDLWYFAMGDRKQDRMDWRIALQARPLTTLRLDVGHQTDERTFEREDGLSSKTEWKAQQGFAALSWVAHERVTFTGNVTYGVEEFTLTGGPEPTAGLGPLRYDGTTLRFMPGACVRLSGKWTLEGFYEGVRYEDTGDEGVIDVLEADHDRTTIRSSYRLGEPLTVTATYRRYEFDENRWDDTITDLYALSLSGRF